MPKLSFSINFQIPDRKLKILVNKLYKIVALKENLVTFVS